MSVTWMLYERWKAKRPALGVSAAAKELGVSHTAIAFWRDGRNGSPAVLEKLCEDLGEDFARVLAEAWAEGARDNADRRALLRLAKRFRGAGLAVALGALPLMAPSASQAHSVASESIHYANAAAQHDRLGRFGHGRRPSKRRNLKRWRTYPPVWKSSA